MTKNEEFDFMTKDEALDFIIQKYKNNIVSLEDVRIAYCDEIKQNCQDCPFRHGQSCESDIAEKLIERLIKVEEKTETNLEHYIIRDESEAHLNTVDGDEHEIYRLVFKPGTSCSFFGSEQSSFIQWLFSPYKPPKPKYKLTQFEYDLLRVHLEEVLPGRIRVPGRIRDYWELKGMCGNGYFKDIPTDVPISDILDNCEVTHDEA